MINSELKGFELKKVGKECFTEFYGLLLEAFIPEELRSAEDALSVLDNHDFILYNIIYEGRSIGYISAWTLPDITFIEHFVMRKEVRGRGFGEAAVKAICDIHNDLVLECEPREDEIKARRAAFYERCGFIENPIEYAQPSYREGYGEVPLMLMSYPVLLPDAEKTVSDLYKKVYRRYL